MYIIDPYRFLESAFGEAVDWYDLNDNDEFSEIAPHVGTNLYIVNTPKASALLDVYISPSQMIIDIAATEGKMDVVRAEVARRISNAAQYEYAMDKNVAIWGRWNTPSAFKIYLLNGKFGV